MGPEVFAGLGIFGVITYVLKYLFDRLNRVEARMAAAELAIQAEQEKRIHVCLAFVSIRDRLIRFARQLFEHKLISDKELAEVEATPDIATLLSQAPQVISAPHIEYSQQS